MTTRREILTQSIAAREEEILGYDINIANYQHSLELIGEKKQAKADRAENGDKAVSQVDAELDAEADALIEYEPKLASLLASERRERSKAAIFLEAAKRHLASLPSEEE